MNSASLRAFDEQSAATGEALWPAVVTLGGVSYAACIARPREFTILTDSAEAPGEARLTVRLRKALLAAAPAENSVLSWEGKKWKIRSILGQEAAAAVWVLHCEPAP